MNKEHHNNKVCRLNKALYSLKQSPRQWYKHLVSILKKRNFKAIPYDEGCFISTEKECIIACHVDDMIATGSSVLQQQIGALLYLARKTRPYAVNRASGFSSNPNKTHFRALDCIWKYLNKYPYFGLLYARDNYNITLKGADGLTKGLTTTRHKEWLGNIQLSSLNIP